MTVEFNKLDPIFKFVRPYAMCNIRLISISEESHEGEDQIYGKTGVIYGIIAQSDASDEGIHRLICWSTHKQTRGSNTLFCTDIISEVDDDDRGFDLKMSYDSIFKRNKIRDEIYVGSRGLFDIIETIHESREYRLNKTEAIIRD